MLFVIIEQEPSIRLVHLLSLSCSGVTMGGSIVTQMSTTSRASEEVVIESWVSLDHDGVG